VQRWDPEAARREQAQERLRALAPRPGATVYLILDDSKKAKRGKRLEAVAKLKDPTTGAYIRGHQYVCGTLLFRAHVIPWGIRLCVNNQACAADDLCPTVVQACREQCCPLASTRKRHRHLVKPGWKLKAGRSGHHLVRRRRPATLAITKPHGSARDRVVEAGWLMVGHLGLLQVICSRTGTAQTIRWLVTKAPELSAAQLLQTYDRRWTSAPGVQDAKPRLGLGQYQHRSYGAAVTHRHLVCFAYALLTYLRLHHADAQGHRTHDKAADLSTATAQDQLRCLLWEDLSTSLKEARQDHPVIEELEQFRVA
jgi:hypothetical protein